MLRTFILSLFCLIILTACPGDPANRVVTDHEMGDTTPIVGLDHVDVAREVEDDYRIAGRTFQNEKFRNVQIEQIDSHMFRISGEARVYEANVRYVIEDGHYELKQGYITAANAAPEWGSFRETITFERRDRNRSVLLILFEESAEDGSRQDELIIRLL
jgi:hypothetical protein